MTIVRLGNIEIDIDSELNPGHSEKQLLHRLLAVLKHQEQTNKERFNRIMATQTELAAQLRAVAAGLKDANAELTKVAAESDNLLQQIKDLKDALDAQDNASQDLLDAVAAVADSANSVASGIKKVDDKVPDTVPSL